MRISSGVTDQYIPFYAESSGSAVTGLTSFSVTRARNGATGTAMTTPTTVEVGSGLYWLLADEDMTITSGNIEEEMCFIISHGSADTVIAQITLVDDAYHATASALATAQTDLNTLTGSDGVTLATTQGNYAPAKAGDSMALTASAVDDIWDEAISGHSTAGTTGKAVTDILADTNELQTDDIPTTLATLSTFDPAADTVAHVTLVDTTTTNTDMISASDILTTQMTESYAADGAAPTLTQALLLIQQMLGDFSISGTTLTIKKVDGSTTAATFTLDSSTSPTSVTRAS